MIIQNASGASIVFRRALMACRRMMRTWARRLNAMHVSSCGRTENNLLAWQHVPMRALEFGPIAELEEKHPDAVRTIAILPEPTQTHPCTIIDAKNSALDPDYVEVML